MTCGALRPRGVTSALREGNVLILKACGYVFSGICGAVTRLEQLYPFGGIRNPIGWWRKRADSGPDEATDVCAALGSKPDVVENAMAQCFPGQFR